MTTLPEEAASFLSHFSGPHTFQTFDDRPQKDPRLSRVLYDSSELAEQNAQGTGVFMMVNEGDGQGRKTANVTRVRAYCADFDGAPLPHVWPLKPSMIVETSPDKYHAYWVLQQGEVALLDSAAWNAQQEAIAQAVGSQPNDCKALNRVMRIPGFLHQKGDPFISHIVSATGERFTLAEIQIAFPLPVTPIRPAPQERPMPAPEGRKPNTQVETRRKYALTALHGLADELAQVGEGERNNTLNGVSYRAGRLIGGRHLERGEVEAELSRAAQAAGLADSEIRATLHSALTAGMADPEALEDVSQKIGTQRHGVDVGPPVPWPARAPLPPRLPEAPTLPAEMVPERLRSWLLDIAELNCIPLEYVAAPALAGLSGLIGRSVSIKPECFTDWAVTPNTWAAIVGSPGQMKSLAVKEALAPLTRLEARAAEEFRLVQQRAEIEAELLQAERAQLKGKKGAGLTREALQDLKRREEENTVTARRYALQNVTVEKLGELLRENPRGLTVVRDELASWLHDHAREERAEALGFYLAAWNGDGAYTFDRIGRGTIYIPQVCVSVVGGIQPGPLGAFIADSRAGSKGDHGLLQRFQLFVYPDSLGTWERPNRQRDHAAKNRAFDLYEALDGLYNPEAETQAVLTFDAEAQQIWNNWRDELEGRLRGHEFEGVPGFESHLSKYRSLVPSLAAVFHLIEVAVPGMTAEGLGQVSAESLNLALNWAAFLEAHARKVYAGELGLSMLGAYALADKIKAGSVKDGDRTRDLRRKDWAELSSGRFDTALAQLQALGWVRLEDVPTDGAPREVLRLHPDLMKGNT